jgi:hypothetical protein
MFYIGPLGGGIVPFFSIVFVTFLGITSRSGFEGIIEE